MNELIIQCLQISSILEVRMNTHKIERIVDINLLSLRELGCGKVVTRSPNNSSSA
jgi:hypothetical protein